VTVRSPLPVAKSLTLWRGHATQPFVSHEYRVRPFDRAVLSWNCDGPAVFELEVDGVRHCMGRWGERPRSASVAQASSLHADCSVHVDTLVLECPARAFRFHVRPARGTIVTLVAVTHWKSGSRSVCSQRRSRAWGTVLAVPCRSQFAERKDASRICSPTSLAMVLEFHGVTLTTRAVAAGVYDHAAKVFGNWPFNTAFAHKVSGLGTFVCRGSCLADLEREVTAGRPVIISHAWRKGDLDGAPLPASSGHLIVVVGFTPKGDVIVNDPAGRIPPLAKRGTQGESVRRIYRRRQLHTTWLERGQGIMYILRRARD
jgi:uncharacterized protein YvpB